MRPKKEKEWYKARGIVQLVKNDKVIREYRFNDYYNRRRITQIWLSEVKPNGIDELVLVIKPD